MLRYVHPDICDDAEHGRGSLSGRLASAGELGCELVEVWAGPIENEAEAARAGLAPGALLDKDVIARLYAQSDGDVSQARYIMRTAPLPSESDRPGASAGLSFSWSDLKWVSQLAEMLLNIAGRLGSAPSVVEIQPGDGACTHADLILAGRIVRERLEKNLGVAPRIWVRNYGGGLLRSGGEMAEFWQAARVTRGVAAWLGLCLDADALWAAGPERFAEELATIPGEAVRALRIHHRYMTPALDDEIPWRLVFSRRAALSPGIPITPTVRRRADIADTIRFCEELLAGMRDAAQDMPPT